MKILLRLLLSSTKWLSVMLFISAGLVMETEPSHDIAALAASFTTIDTNHSMVDRFMGKEDAPVTVIEYSSLTCPHCAEFHTQVLPRFKTIYIDSGKVKLVYRDFPLDPIATAAAVLTHCVPQDMYFRFLDAIFSSQKIWSVANKPHQALTNLVRLGGMSETEVNQCLSNTVLLANLNTVKNEAVRIHGIKATPSFIIGNKNHVGVTTYATLAALVEEELRKIQEHF